MDIIKVFIHTCGTVSPWADSSKLYTGCGIDQFRRTLYAVDGELHREDGPAMIVTPLKGHFYYLNGIKIFPEKRLRLIEEETDPNKILVLILEYRRMSLILLNHAFNHDKISKQLSENIRATLTLT